MDRRRFLTVVAAAVVMLRPSVVWGHHKPGHVRGKDRRPDPDPEPVPAPAYIAAAVSDPDVHVEWGAAA